MLAPAVAVVRVVFGLLPVLLVSVEVFDEGDGA